MARRLARNIYPQIDTKGLAEGTGKATKEEKSCNIQKKVHEIFKSQRFARLLKHFGLFQNILYVFSFLKNLETFRIFV